MTEYCVSVKISDGGHIALLFTRSFEEAQAIAELANGYPADYYQV